MRPASGPRSNNARVLAPVAGMGRPRRRSVPVPAAPRVIPVRVSQLLAALSIVLLAGCASSGPAKWSGTPAEQPPAESELQPWNVVWDDAQHEWSRFADDTPPIDGSEVGADLWVYEAGSIVLRIEASERLNLSRGEAHTVAVHVLQTQEIGALTGYLEFPTEVFRLLRRGTEDPNVLAMERAIVGPGRETLMRVDRAAQARDLVLVIGFSDFSRSGATRVVPIPGIQDVPRGRARFSPGNVIDTFNPFTSAPPPRPARIEGWLALGETEIASLDMVAR